MKNHMHFCNDCGSTELGDNCFLCKTCKKKHRTAIKNRWNKSHPDKIHEFYERAKTKRLDLVIIE